MNSQKSKEILEKYAKGLCTPDEKAWVESWYNKENFYEGRIPHDEIDSAMEAVRYNLPGSPQSAYKLWSRIAIAASILICLGITSLLLFHKEKPETIISKNQSQDLSPGGNKAILTIGNGQKIILTGAQNGQLAVQGAMTVNKTSDGQVVYQANQNTSTDSVFYNTMTTPRGGKYDLLLADGTKVWLDAASSITYPSSFGGNNREVKITGQVYFEVAHDASKPFRVTVHEQTVEVLGTHFNINAYDDEPSIKTTLLEGKVKIYKAGKSAILKPGQQSLLNLSENTIKVQEVDVDGETAWKDGHFHFDGDNIQTVMRQLSRWYDVDVEYVGNIPNREFSGNINRDSKASVVLQILSISRVHFKIQGKKIIVTP
jgi:transmembrane sensor